MQGRGRLILALIVALFSLAAYWMSQEYNPITAENQHVQMSADQEIALGLKAVPEMEAEYGGPAPDARGQARVEQVGNRLVSRTNAHETPYRFAFHLLNDERTINAFALPGGPVFITDALYKRLQTDGEVAAVLGHEIGHVVARHGAQQL